MEKTTSASFVSISYFFVYEAQFWLVSCFYVKIMSCHDIFRFVVKNTLLMKPSTFTVMLISVRKMQLKAKVQFLKKSLLKLFYSFLLYKFHILKQKWAKLGGSGVQQLSIHVWDYIVAGDSLREILLWTQAIFLPEFIKWCI